MIKICAVLLLLVISVNLNAFTNIHIIDNILKFSGKEWTYSAAVISGVKHYHLATELRRDSGNRILLYSNITDTNRHYIQYTIFQNKIKDVIYTLKLAEISRDFDRTIFGVLRRKFGNPEPEQKRVNLGPDNMPVDINTFNWHSGNTKIIFSVNQKRKDISLRFKNIALSETYQKTIDKMKQDK